MKNIKLLGSGKFSNVYKIKNTVLKFLKKNDANLIKSAKRELFNNYMIKKHIKANSTLSPELYKNILVLKGYLGSHLKSNTDYLKSEKNLELEIGVNTFVSTKDFIYKNIGELFYFDFYESLTLSDYIDNNKLAKKKLFLENLPNNCRKIDNLKIIRDILQGLDFLHKLSIAHHDLKVDNIILVNDNNDCYAKIIDFGLAAHEKHLSNNKSYVTCGSFPYMSPEKINLYFLEVNNPNLNEVHYYDAYKSDIWSVGIILYLLCNLRFPFTRAHKSDPMYQLFLNDNKNSIILENITEFEIYKKDNTNLEDMTDFENKVFQQFYINGSNSKDINCNLITLMLQEDVKKRVNIKNIIHQIDYIL